MRFPLLLLLLLPLLLQWRRMRTRKTMRMTFCSSIYSPSLSVVVVGVVFPALPIHHPNRHHLCPAFRPFRCPAFSRAVGTVAVASIEPELPSGTSPAPERRPSRVCASGPPHCRTHPSCPSCRAAARAAVRPRA
uniref:Secreted protein n=1 Tax=Anopheles darlingi TaxID=43151 RepID=A0A2M4DJG1_ANODA